MSQRLQLPVEASQAHPVPARVRPFARSHKAQRVGALEADWANGLIVGKLVRAVFSIFSQSVKRVSKENQGDGNIVVIRIKGKS